MVVMETNLYKYVAEEVYMYTPIIWWWLDPKRWIQQYAGNSFEKVDHPKGYPSYRITRFERRFRASLSSEDPKVRVMARRASSMPAPPLENGETWERRASQTCRWNRNVSFKLLWLAMWRFQGGKFSMFSSDIYMLFHQWCLFEIYCDASERPWTMGIRLINTKLEGTNWAIQQLFQGG